jgi:hypothetical protein
MFANIAGMNRQIIHLYALCWNEAQIIPFFLRHYRSLVDRIHVYDNRSTDASRELLAGDPAIDVTSFDIDGDSFVDTARRVCDEMWRESRGVADWVILVDMDEHLFHPDLRRYLEDCTVAGVTAIKTTGYEMMALSFPPIDALLAQTVTSGVRNAVAFDKFSIFNPNAIENTNFRPGRHESGPDGQVVWPARSEVKLLHYKKLGLDYLIARMAELRTGLRPGDIENGWGGHYLQTPERIREEFEAQLRVAEPVPGLGNEVENAESLDLYLRMDENDLLAERIEGERYIFSLPAEANVVEIVSSNADPKFPYVGVPVVGITITAEHDRTPIALDDAALFEGWWAPADDPATGSVRWTDGRARLELPPGKGTARSLEIELAQIPNRRKIVPSQPA